MSGQNYKRLKDGVRLDIRGMDTVNALDEMPPGKYPYLQNVRAYQRQVIKSRSILGSPLFTFGFPVHTIRRLNDSTPSGPLGGYALIVAAGNYLYVAGESGVTTFAFALSGEQGVSMVPFRPDASPKPWMYIGDDGTNYRKKVSANGELFYTGIAEPQLAPSLVAIGDGGGGGSFPDWIANHHYGNGIQINPTVGNAGNYIYVSVVSQDQPGPPFDWFPISGNVEPVWPQTPGDEVSDGPTGFLSWQNTGLTGTGGGGGGPGVLTGVYTYWYTYRSTLTGAKSNPSPSREITVSAENVGVTCWASDDPQVDVIDVWRQGQGLLDPTYVGTIVQAVTLTFNDQNTDLAVANNPLMERDNFQPFPSIDEPASGTGVWVTVGSNFTRATGVSFNVRWAPGNIIVLTKGVDSYYGTLYNRPTNSEVMTILFADGAIVPPDGTYSWKIQQPTLLAQGMPALWGPTDNAAFMFACGDPLRPGTLYWTKGNNPDSAPDTNQQEVTSPSEPLMNGVIIGGLGMVFSTERAWLIYPNFTSALSTVTGTAGSTWTLIEAVANRGLYARFGICTDGGANVFFIARDGIYVSPGGAGSVSITDDIYNLFPHENFTPVPVTVGPYTIHPPDYSNPTAMRLSFASAYLYFDYQDVSGVQRTLVYDTLAQGWCIDVYGAPVLIHANQEGYEQDTVLVGCSDNTVRILTPSGTEAVTSVALMPSFNAGEGRADKFFGDIFVDALVGTGLSVAVQGYYNLMEQTVTLTPSTLAPASPPARTPYILDFPSDVGLYARDVSSAFTWTLNPNIGIYIWQPSLVEVPEFIANRPSDWDDGGDIGAKWIQGLIVEADTGNMVKVFLGQSGDDLSTHVLSEVAQFNGRSVKAFSFVEPFVAHTVRLISGDSVDWRIWGIKWVFEPYPELCEVWETEGMSHGMQGWQHVREMNIAHISTSDLTLTLTPDYGSPIVLTVPNSGGIHTKTKVTIPPNKFKIVSYKLSCPVAFRPFLRDMEVKCKAWGDPGPYQILRPFGGMSNAGALV